MRRDFNGSSRAPYISGALLDHVFAAPEGIPDAMAVALALIAKSEIGAKNVEVDRLVTADGFVLKR